MRLQRLVPDMSRRKRIAGPPVRIPTVGIVCPSPERPADSETAVLINPPPPPAPSSAASAGLVVQPAREAAMATTRLCRGANGSMVLANASSSTSRSLRVSHLFEEESVLLSSKNQINPRRLQRQRAPPNFRDGYDHPDKTANADADAADANTKTTIFSPRSLHRSPNLHGPQFRLPLGVPPVGVDTGVVFEFLRNPGADISWVEASCRRCGARVSSSGDGGGPPSGSTATAPAPRLWERFLALRRHGPFVLHQDEPFVTRASLRAYMALPFVGVDAAWMHFWRLYLCSVSPPVETLDLRRLLLHLTNARTVQSLRTSSDHNGRAQQQRQRGVFVTPRDWGGGASRIVDETGVTDSSADGLVANLLNPLALGVEAVEHLGKWGLNETALMLEMIMSSGAVTGVRISGPARKKQSERYLSDATSPFMGHLGAILSSNANLTYLDICTTFRFDRLSGRPIGLAGLLRAMDTSRGGTACLLRIDLGAGCGAVTKRKKRKGKKKKSTTRASVKMKKSPAKRVSTVTTSLEDIQGAEESAADSDHSSLDVSHVGDSSSIFIPRTFISSTNYNDENNRTASDTSAIPVKQHASPVQRADIRESHWSAIASILVEGVVHCKTIREVGLYDCHRSDCANILLPAVAKMLLLTKGRLQTLRLRGCKFPPPSEPIGNGTNNNPESRHSSVQSRSHRKRPHSKATFVLYNAILESSTSVDPPAALCTLDISDTTMGSHAAMLLAKSCQHLKYVNLERLSAPANGYRCFLRMLSEQSRSLNPHALRLARRPTRLQQQVFHADCSSGNCQNVVQIPEENAGGPSDSASMQKAKRRPKALVQSSRLQRQRIGAKTRNKNNRSSLRKESASNYNGRRSSCLSTRGGVISRSQRESRGGLHASSLTTQAGDHFRPRAWHGSVRRVGTGGGAGGPFTVPVSETPSFAVMSGAAPPRPPSFVQDSSVILLAVDAARVRASHLLVLDLRFVGLGKAGGTGVASALRACTRLTHVDLSGNDIGSVGSNALLQALYPSCATSLVILHLSDNHMGDSVGHALAKTLSLCRSLVTLGLAGNRLTNDSASLIWSSALGKGCCPRLLDLDLSRNRIDSSVCMLQAYRESRRRLLMVQSRIEGRSIRDRKNLSTARLHNWSGVDSQVDVAGRKLAGERRLLCLEKMILSKNLLEESSASILADILQLRYRDDATGTSTETGNGLGSSLLLHSGAAKVPNRKKVYLGQINDDDFDILSASRHVHDTLLPPPAPSLTYLDLSYNMLGARGGSHIGRGLAGSIYIRELRLRGCRLGSVGSLAIAKGLYRNGNTLCVLDLSENLICCDTRSINAGGTFGLELHAVRQLCDAVSAETKATMLDTLVLANNELGRSGAEMFRDAVRKNQSLTVLDLTGNNLVDMRCLSTIEKRLSQNRKFTLIQSPLDTPTPGVLRVESAVKSAVAVASEAMASWEDFSSTSTVRVDAQPLFQSKYQTLRASNGLLRRHRTVSPPSKRDAADVVNPDEDAVYASILLEAQQKEISSNRFWQSTVKLEQPIRKGSSSLSKTWGPGKKVQVEQTTIGKTSFEKKKALRKKKTKKKRAVKTNDKRTLVNSNTAIPDLETASRIVLQGLPTEQLDEEALSRALSRLRNAKDLV